VDTSSKRNCTGLWFIIPRLTLAHHLISREHTVISVPELGLDLGGMIHDWTRNCFSAFFVAQALTLTSLVFIWIVVRAQADELANTETFS
jgi:hypothetical protein